jgi:hypothetical protein
MMSKSYPTAEGIATRMASLAAAHPTSCSISDLGTSVQGRALRCLRVTRTTHPKAGVILVAGQHADELIGPDALLDFIEKVLIAAETSSDE